MKHFSVISLRLSYGCSARHLPGKNRKILGPKPISEHYIFASVSVGSWIVIFNYYLFTALTGEGETVDAGSNMAARPAVIRDSVISMGSSEEEGERSGNDA